MEPAITPPSPPSNASLVEFRMWLRPAGVDRPIWFPVTPEVSQCAHDLEVAGYTFEADCLTPEHVCLTCYGPLGPGDWADVDWGDISGVTSRNEASEVRRAVSELVVASHRLVRDSLPPKGSEPLC